MEIKVDRSKGYSRLGASYVGFRKYDDVISSYKEGLNLSKEIEDSELADVAAVSTGNNYEIGSMITKAMSNVGNEVLGTVVKVVLTKDSNNNCW